MSTEDRLARLASYLAADPSNTRLLADLADGHLRAGSRDTARGYLKQILAIEPRDALARYRLAVLERSEGKLAVAARLLRELLAEGHAASAIRVELARTLAQQNDWAGANEVLTPVEPAALPEEEGDAIWLLRIRAHHHLGQLDEAREQGQQWLRARARLPVTGYAALATVELDAERIKGVAELLKQCSNEEINGSSELQCASGFLALADGEVEAAAARFDRAVKLQPESGRSHLGIGLAAALAGSSSTAMAALHEATRAMPSHLGSWHALAWLQMLVHDLDGAALTFKQAEKQNRNFGETHGGLALVAALQGNRSEASDRLRLALKLDRKSINAEIAKSALESDARSLNDIRLQPGGPDQLEQLLRKDDLAQGGLARVLGNVVRKQTGQE